MADPRILVRLTADVAVLAVFAAAYVFALDFPARSARYPLVICAIGVCLALANLIRDIILTYRGQVQDPDEERWDARHATMMSLVLLMLVPSIGLFGMLLGTVIWLPLVLHFVAGMRWHFALIDTTVVAAFLLVIEHTGLGQMPSGLLSSSLLF